MRLAYGISLIGLLILGCSPRDLYRDYEGLEEVGGGGTAYIARVFIMDPGPTDGYYTYVNLLHKDASFAFEKNGENVVVIRGKESLKVEWVGPKELRIGKYDGDLQRHVSQVYGITITLDPKAANGEPKSQL